MIASIPATSGLPKRAETSVASSGRHGPADRVEPLGEFAARLDVPEVDHVDAIAFGGLGEQRVVWHLLELPAVHILDRKHAAGRRKRMDHLS